MGFVEIDGIKRLRRVFSFDDFGQALDFTSRVGELAEAEGHHPALLTEWGQTTVSWWTHKIKGLHRNDFIMAARRTASIGPRSRVSRRLDALRKNAANGRPEARSTARASRQMSATPV